MITLIVSVLIIWGVSFVCSMTEAMLLSLNELKLEKLANEGKKSAALMLGMKKNISRPIAAILILNTTANTGGATVAGAAFDEVFGEQWMWVFSTFLTVSILLGTEIFPKVLGVAFAEKLTPYIAYPLKRTIWILTPFIYITDFVFKAVKSKAPDDENSQNIIEDIQAMILSATTNKILDNQQSKMIMNTSKLQNTIVRDIMIPLEKMAFLNSKLTFEENMRFAKDKMHTRYPVSIDEDPQNISHYVNIKEIALLTQDMDKREAKLDNYLREIAEVEEDMDLSTAIQLLMHEKAHLAIVKDEDKIDNKGMITMEDIIAVVLGAGIADEFGRPERQINT